MKLVEKHIIKHSNKNFNEMKNLTSLFGGIYNQVNYQIRQNFFNGLPFKHKYDWFNEIKTNKEIFNQTISIFFYRN